MPSIETQDAKKIKNIKTQRYKTLDRNQIEEIKRFFTFYFSLESEVEALKDAYEKETNVLSLFYILVKKSLKEKNLNVLKLKYNELVDKESESLKNTINFFKDQVARSFAEKKSNEMYIKVPAPSP